MTSSRDESSMWNNEIDNICLRGPMDFISTASPQELSARLHPALIREMGHQEATPLTPPEKGQMQTRIDPQGSIIFLPGVGACMRKIYGRAKSGMI